MAAVIFTLKHIHEVRLVMFTNQYDTSHTAVAPFFTASWAYSTWNKWPSGEKTVIALS